MSTSIFMNFIVWKIFNCFILGCRPSHCGAETGKQVSSKDPVTRTFFNNFNSS